MYKVWSRNRIPRFYSRDGEKWQRSSAAGTTATCLLNQTTDGTWYRCMITEPTGAITYSDAATLTVRDANAMP